MKAAHLLLAGLLSTSATTLLAASIQPTPEPGLWISESTTLINGVDMQAKMLEVRQNMLAGMPEEQRAMAEKMMNDAEEAGHRRCINAELAKKMTDPETLLADAREQMPGCDLQVDQKDDDQLEFHGNCANSEGFNGDLSGDMQMVSSKEMRSNFLGEGTYQLPAQAAGALGEEFNGPVKVEHKETSKWVGSDCGDTPVEPLS
ncbi:MAG: DUF3617 family protein [Halopseudomonas sp.]|uniref:DUF3617 family protein n=1 Tax=Halopseudomonas sp. TaxID=2901191 RepID=UPI0030023D15